MEATIHKEVVRLPKTGEASKAYYCGQEIGRQLQSGISAQSATGSARWGNPLLELETTKSRIQEISDRLAALEAEIPNLRASYKHDLAIRDGFFSSFLTDQYPA